MLAGFFKYYIYPIATLAGSIIGVGFLSLPYITQKVGIWPMLFYFAAVTLFIVFLHVIFGKIALKTPDFKRWPGFVGYYLGAWPKVLVLVSNTLGLLGVLAAYIIIGGEFLAAILIPVFGGSQIVYTLMYFALASFLVYVGVKIISRIDLFALLALIIVLFIILIKGLSNFEIENIFASNIKFQISNAFLPYGAIMFSLWGTGLIPEIEEMLRGKKKSLTRVIVIGTLIPAIIYLAFIFLILGITGPHTTESALVGLKNVLGNGVISLAFLTGIITTFIAFIAQGLLLKKVLMYDVGVKPFTAWGLVCFTPLLLVLLGLNSFIGLISLVGGVLLGIDGVLIMLIYRKIGGKWYVAYPLMLVFILGAVYSLIYFVN